jgi:hypothetical protein
MNIESQFAAWVLSHQLYLAARGPDFAKRMDWTKPKWWWGIWLPSAAKKEPLTY